MKQTQQILLPKHGGQLRQIATRYGVPAEQLIDFSANINPAGPPASVLTALQSALTNPASLVVYPDLELIELKTAIAKAMRILPQNIAIANGFVPLLDAALHSLRSARCLLPVPSFSEYRQTLENACVEAVPYYLSSQESFSFEHEVLLRAALENRCDTLLLANPQNPSGVLCEADKIVRLIKMAAKEGVKVLLDEAFIDYVPNHSAIQAAVGPEDLFVFRSVTKFFAIPGLRVAYVVGNVSDIENLNRMIAPWPVTTLASDAVCAALRDGTYAETTRRENNLRRIWMERELARLHIVTYPSSTNFLLLRFPTEVDVSALWEKMIVEEQIVVRSCSNFEGLATGHLRIAVRSEAENRRCIRSLERVLARIIADGDSKSAI